jgi:hypothetical protein
MWSNPFTAERCAARGARLLDRKRPEWPHLIDPVRLDVRSGCECPLGQVYGLYRDGLRAIAPWRWLLLLVSFWPEWHGFMRWPSSTDDGRELNAAWRAEIASRLARDDNPPAWAASHADVALVP